MDFIPLPFTERIGIKMFVEICHIAPREIAVDGAAVAILGFVRRHGAKKRAKGANTAGEEIKLKAEEMQNALWCKLVKLVVTAI